MWHYGMNRWMAFGTVAFWVVIGLVVWALMRSGQRSERHSVRHILDERYANGELTKDEYEERRRVLVDH